MQLENVPIGWVIKQKVDRCYHANIRVYATEAVARRYSNGMDVEQVYVQRPVQMKTVINLMSGEPVEIRADTPAHLDPSTETYWSA